MNDQPLTAADVKEKSKVKKHDLNSNGLPKRIFTCKYCNSEYTQKTNLYRHIRQLHKRKGNILSEQQPPEYFTCTACQDKFPTKSLLSFHEALLHPIRKGKLVIPCPLCDYSGSKGDLLGHYRAVHNVQIEIGEYSFKSALDFYVWKTNVERSTNTQYAKRQKHHVLVNGVIIDMLHCHRDGFYRPEGKNLRNAKLKGTNKINGYCPAFMRVMTYADDRVSVLFLKTHFGHDYEIDRLALTRSERDSVAAKIALGLSFDDILTELHSSKQERLRIMTKKDLYNIEVAYNLSTVRGRNIKYDINVQHNDALKVPPDFVTVENNCWIIRSISKENVTYTVEPLNTDCDINNCLLRCKFCQCCGHYYKCSCTEQIPLVMMCKHKHVAHLTIKDSQIIIQANCISQNDQTNNSIAPTQNNLENQNAEELMVNDQIPTSSDQIPNDSITETNLGQPLLLDNCGQLTTLVIQNLPNETATMFVPTNNINARKTAIRSQLAGILQAVESSELEEELHLIQSLLEPVTQTIESMKQSENIITPEVIQPVCKQIRLDDETAAQYFSTATGADDDAADTQIISTNISAQSNLIDQHNNPPILITYTLNQPSQ